MIPNKGDTVKVWKWVLDREYSAEGPVEQLRYDHGRYLIRVAGDWWVAVNYDENDEEDPGGCFTEHHTEWQCTNRQACWERRHEMAVMMQEMAWWADMEARERGAFAIGGGVG